MGQDPEGLGLHVGAAAAPFAQLRVLLRALDGLIDQRGAVHEAVHDWDRTGTTDRGRHVAHDQSE